MPEPLVPTPLEQLVVDIKHVLKELGHIGCEELTVLDAARVVEQANQLLVIDKVVVHNHPRIEEDSN